MKKQAGNIVSWGSVCVVIGFLYTNNPYLIVLGVFIAAIMDMFDGKLARKYGNNTKEARMFGELTDSLCDSFNFGFVPAFIIPNLLFSSSNILFISCTMIFMVAGIFRLARFSVCKTSENIESYIGLPITVAGPILGLLTILSNNIVIFIICNLIFSYLMISKYEFKKIKI